MIGTDARRRAAAALLLLACAAPTALRAQEAAPTAATALAYTRQTLEQTRVIIDSDRTHNEKLAALDDLLRGFLDTDAMGKAALADHWKQLNAGQQKEFLGLFRELFQRTYVQKLLLFDRPDFEYGGEAAEGDFTRVDTSIVTPRDEFAVTYKLRAHDGRWLAFDIQIEDLSLTDNFRRQLDNLLAKSSVENVLDRMRRKYGDADGDS